MPINPHPRRNTAAPRRGFLARLARNRSGNTMILVAASIVPLLGMVGGGIDMGRSYLSETRLQQACDAGVLAARKKLGSEIVLDGDVPDDVGEVGNRFFNINFRDGAYGTENRTFEMVLEDDYSISGTATVDVPTTVMRVLGSENVAVEVNCEARLNFSNTDIMLVLDTTGSMNRTNPGDSDTKIAALRSVVKSFHAQLEASKDAGTRVRYGFVPYSSNVNVGYLLKSGWMVDEWDYQGRDAITTGGTETYAVYNTTYPSESGEATDLVAYESDTCPADTADWTELSYIPKVDDDDNDGDGINDATDPDDDNDGTPDATDNDDDDDGINDGADSDDDDGGTSSGSYNVVGIDYWCETDPDSGQITVHGTEYDDYTYTFVQKKTGYATRENYKWRYKPIEVNVGFLKGATDEDVIVGGSIDVRMAGNPSPTPEMMTAWFRGCIEERDTYEIDDYSDVDFTKALDLDLDRVPDSSDPDTQWRPMLNEISFVRSIYWNGTGSFEPNNVVTEDDFMVAAWAGYSDCPTASRKLAEMDASEVASYVRFAGS